MRTLHSAHRNAVTYVSGDRKREGIFPNLSIFENLLLSVYQDYRLGGWLNLIDRRKLQPVAPAVALLPEGAIPYSDYP